MKLKSLICIIEKIFAIVTRTLLTLLVLVWHEYICTILLYVQQGSPLHEPKEPLSIRVIKINNKSNKKFTKYIGKF